MYNYDFKENEEYVLMEMEDSIVDINDTTYTLSVVKTNKNILLFNNANKNNPLGGRAVNLPDDYFLELKIPLNDLDYKVENDNTIINYLNNEIVLYNINIGK